MAQGKTMEDYVKTQVEALADKENAVKLTVTIEAAEIDKRIKKAYKEFASRYNFPGFRKGKAPRPVIDNALGHETVRGSVTDDLVNEMYPLAIDAEGLYPQGRPEFDEIGIVESGSDFTFSATVDVKASFELSSYDPVEIEMPGEKATEKEIQAELDGIADHYFTYENAPANTKIKAESIVDLAIEAKDDDGQRIDSISSDSRIYTIGSGILPDTFDAEIMGLKKGEQKTFKIDNPGDKATLTASLVGVTATITFDVTVNTLKKKVLPEITDEWVKDNLGFDSVEDVRARIVESIEEQKADVLPRLKENLVLDALAKRLEGEPPAAMCEANETELLQSFFQQLQQSGVSFDAYLKQQGLTSDTFKEDVKKQAADEAARGLALDAWARHFGFEATDEDVTAEFESAGAPDPAALQEEWRTSGRLHLVREGVARTKALDDAIEKAVVKEFVEEPEEKKPAKKAKSSKKKADEAEAAADEA